MPAGHGEEPTAVVHLDEPPAPAPGWERPPREHMHPGARGAHLGVGVDRAHHLRRDVADEAGSFCTYMVKIDAYEPITEHHTNPGRGTGPHGGNGISKTAPCR